MELLLDVHGIRAHYGGRLLAFLFAKEGFPRQHELSLERFEWDLETVASSTLNGKLTLPLEIDRPGAFALKLMHDDDGTGKMRKRLGFIPDKGVAYSGGARITYRVPTFQEASIQVSPDLNLLRLSFSMQYLTGWLSEVEVRFARGMPQKLSPKRKQSSPPLQSGEQRDPEAVR